MHVYVHGVWRWQRWQIQDNRTRSRAEDTVQNGQRLMCVFTLCPTDLPQASPEQQSSKAQSGLWRCPVSATWKILRSGKTVDWVWGGTGIGFEVGQVCLQHSNTPKKLEIPQAHAQTVHVKTYTVSVSAGLIRTQKQSLKEDTGGRRRELTYILNKF